jgi:hypothetical protein
MKSIRLTENELSRIVRKIVNEEFDENTESQSGGGIPLCKDVKVSQGVFIGEKDNFGYLMYKIDANTNKILPANSQGSPRKCRFVRNTTITL